MSYVSRIVELVAGRGVGEVSVGGLAGCRCVLPADGSGVSLRCRVEAVLGCCGVGAGVLAVNLCC